MSRAALNLAELLEGAGCSALTMREGALLDFSDYAIRAFFEVLGRKVVEEGARIIIPGFGTFYRATWSPKVGRLAGAERHRIAFRPSNKLRGRS